MYDHNLVGDNFPLTLLSPELTFAPNTKWTEYYSRGAEIQAYYEKVCKDFGVTEKLKLHYEVTGARWLSDEQQWEVTSSDLASGTSTSEKVDILISAQGRINKPTIPKIPGLDTFGGRIVHTAQWPSDLDVRDKRVAVVGNGASGQQVLPNLLRQGAAHIEHYVRSKVYVTARFRDGLVSASHDNPGAHEYAEEEKRTFDTDGAAYKEYRRDLERGMTNKCYGWTVDEEEVGTFRQQLLDGMLRRLGGHQDWLDRVTPDYAPGCKRLTPAPGYLEAFLRPDVDYFDTGIARITSTGIEAVGSADVRDVDIIVFATGFQDGFYPRFPVIGPTGEDLAQTWRPGGAVGYPETYLGVMAADTPNYFQVLQAQGNAFGGSVPLHCEVSATYIARVLRKLRRDGYTSCSPTQKAAADFNDWVARYFANTVVASSCNSWFKLDGPDSRVVIGWPGTTRHRIETLAEPRWEDFQFEADRTRAKGFEANRFAHWGSGTTRGDEEGDFDILTGHIKLADDIDFASLHNSAYV